jgi:phosphonate degradation associated HDIG domain protein
MVFFDIFPNKTMNQTMNFSIEDIITILKTKGDRQYGGESVSQLEHALQCATLAEAANQNQELIVASLLHDLGHLLPELEKSGNACHNNNDFHEYRAIPYLQELFSLAVTEPIRLHVQAKKYLCAVDSNYWASLSPASKQSLQWQGGVFSEKEAKAFIARPFARQAVQLRQWDDLAKVVGLSTPDLTHFVPFLTTCVTTRAFLYGLTARRVARQKIINYEHN